MKDTKCSGRVDFGNMSTRQCHNEGTYYERAASWTVHGMEPYGEVKPWCGTHAPSKVAARREKRDQTQQAERDSAIRQTAQKQMRYADEVLECTDRVSAIELVRVIAAWGSYRAR